MSTITSSIGISADLVIEEVIPASSTVDVDSIAYSSFVGLKYYIRLYNDSQAVRRRFELTTLKVTNGDVTDSIDSVLGDALDVDTQVLKSGSDMIVRMTNSESFPVSLRATRQII